MSHSNTELRTQNAEQTPDRTSNAAERAFTVQEKVRELMRENPGMPYDEAYSKCKTLPEMQRTFNAMTVPAALPDPINTQELTAAKRKASAQFTGKVQTAANQRGITFQEAWNAMREEEPELWEAMVGNRDVIQETNDRISRPV